MESRKLVGEEGLESSGHQNADLVQLRPVEVFSPLGGKEVC